MEDGVTGEARCIAFVMSSGGWGHNYYEDDFVEGKRRVEVQEAPRARSTCIRATSWAGWTSVTVNTYPEKFPP